MHKTLIISKIVDKICNDKNKFYFDFNCHSDLKLWDLNQKKVFRGYGNHEQSIKEDNKIVGKTYDDLIHEISSILNNFHQDNFSERQWEILIGPWLLSYIRTLFFRIRSFQTCIKNEKINKIIIANPSNYDFTSFETGGLFECMWSQEWDFMFNSRILKNLNLDSKYLESIEINQNFHSCYEYFNSYKKNKKKIFLSKILHFFNFFNKTKKMIVDETYLGLKNELLLQFLNKQTPILLSPNKINYKKKNNKLRENLSINFKKYSNNFEKIIKNFFFDDLPIVFLESFKDLKKTVKLNNWPKAKIIFTSNSFFLNEQFKYFTLRSLPSSKYIVGQHGNGYGDYITHDYLPEYRTCDFFLTWGEKNRKKDISAFNFIRIKKKISLNRKNNMMLIVNRTLGYPTETFEKIQSYTKHFDNKISFLKKLISKSQCEIVYRLHPNHGLRTPHEKKEISKLFSSLEVDSGKTDIYKLINKSKLVVFTYYSTGFLELISSSIPTVCLQENILNYIKQENNTIYKKLIDANIIFLNFQDLGFFLEKNYKNINDWWNSDRIKDLREETAFLLSKKPNKNSLIKLNNSLNNILIK